MISALFNQPDYLAAKKMLDAVALRHEAISANLANVETPGYKRVDLAANFNDQLHQAIAAQSPEQLASLQPSLEVDPTAVAGRDGNSVQLESELLNLQQNTLNHNVSAQLLSSSLLRLQLAITGTAGSV